MESISFNSFEGWFKKPPNPISLFTFFAEHFSQKQSDEPDFAAIKTPIFARNKKELGKMEKSVLVRQEVSMMEQYDYECKHKPDYRNAPEVEKILEDEAEKIQKKNNPTEEETEEFSLLEKFLHREKMEMNRNPYHWEDAKQWKAN